MALDYEEIYCENLKRYGTDIGRTGKMFFADTYADRTHFIFELLQNAEDAIARRGAEWDGERAVSFHLTGRALRSSHFGEPFNEADVRGICGIDESTKTGRLTEIGRFGIGFKSVYAFTDRPEVHSGPEDFAIESFVWPVATPSIDRHRDETVVLLPFKPTDESGHDEIAAGLERLGASSLLFLRRIEEIRWSVEGGQSGHYLREQEAIGENVRRVTVIGQVYDESEVYEEWLVFSREVTTDGGHAAGHVEIAFSLDPEDPMRQRVRPVDDSPLVVFFPTERETRLGFRVQGPYRTIPNRGDVPQYDRWNRRLVRETAALLQEALRWLRDKNWLDTTVLCCLPLVDRGGMFTPLFEETKDALLTEPLLPRFDGGYVSATHALLGSTEALRKLFSSPQLSVLYGEEQELAWLSSDVTPDRAPDVRGYLMQELGVKEVTPQAIIRKLSHAFLAAQSDDWILKLYEFLNSQPALLKQSDWHSLRRQRQRGYYPEQQHQLYNVPLIRLENGRHVTPAKVNGQPQAFLPSASKTDFPTVRAAVCSTYEARRFLQALGLTKPDLVDDVIQHVLPRYREDDVNVSDADYEEDIERIVRAFANDSTAQREKLISPLRETSFVMSVDAGDGSDKWRCRPSGVYLATKRSKELFAGVKGVYFVNEDYECLRGGEVCEFLEELGSTELNSADGVIQHILPKYRECDTDISDTEYEADIKRILEAVATASDTRREKLISELQETAFVMSVDAGDDSERRRKPGETYMSTERLKELLAGVNGVCFVDNNHDCLRGEKIRELLVECGVAVRLRVDDVLQHVLPKYREDRINITRIDYEADIRRILESLANSSEEQRDDFISELRETAFVMSVDVGDDSKWRCRPGQVYLATEPLKELFSGVKGIHKFVDDTYDCLRGEKIRELLVQCGASKFLRFDLGSTSLDLEPLLDLLPQLSPELRSEKAKLLWETLIELERYKWRYFYNADFYGALVNQLNETAWVPNANGDLNLPKFVSFDTLGWEENPFLQSKINFQPPVIESLAREADIELEALDLMKKHNVTADQLREWIGEKNEPPESEPVPWDEEDDTYAESGGNGDAGTGGDETVLATGNGSGIETVARGGTRSGESSRRRRSSGGSGDTGGRRQTKRRPGGKGRRRFISYVEVHPNESEPDPDGLTNADRMELEESAIKFILEHEHEWRCTPKGNKGYDLKKVDQHGKPVRWCEVKAMTGAWGDRPVGLTRAQFRKAQKCGEAYWLYVVEHADTDSPNIVKIQDPAGQARTFTFDHGWREVAV